MTQLIVLSVNLQNYYADKDYRTYARRGHNQTHILADEVVAQAMHYGANVICTQEDEHALALPGFEEVAAACAGDDLRAGEVVGEMRARGRDGAKSETCPLPTRCALVVQLP